MSQNTSVWPTEATRNEAWQQVLDMAIVQRYYGSLWNRGRYKYVASRVFLFICAATSGTAAVIQQFPVALQIGASLAVVLILALEYVQNYSAKLAALNLTCQATRELEQASRELWLDINNLECTNLVARTRIQEIARKLNKIQQWSVDANVKPDDELNENCAKSAYADVRTRYAFPNS